MAISERLRRRATVRAGVQREGIGVLVASAEAAGEPRSDVVGPP